MLRPLIPWPALLIKNKKKTVVISDLHLGYEFELAEMGINIPSQTEKIKENLLRLIEKVRPDRLVILGDLKHSIPKISAQEWQDIPFFLEEIRKKVVEVQIVPGNHDGKLATFLASNVKVTSGRGLLLKNREKIGLFHGHAWPSSKLFEAKFWVIGHNHPTIQFRGMFGFKVSKTAWIKIPVDRKKLTESFLRYRNVKIEGENPERVLEEKYGVKVNCSQLLVMPAFNELLGGLPFNVKDQNEFLGPILKSEGILLDKAEVFLTDGTYLGILKDLKRVV